MLLMLVASINAATVTFVTNPLTGSAAETTAGRQIVNGANGGPVRSFDPAADVITFNPAAFGVDSVQFVNGDTTAPGFPTGGITVAAVLNASAAGQAADRLAEVITEPGAGFFMYFNAGLNVPRLVFSADLNDPDADLAILARFDNLLGQTGILSSVQASNFAPIPEPSSLLMSSGALAGVCVLALRRRRTRT
jgi:hypothetical protein